MTSPVDPLIDPALASQVLARALSRGGEFAEVFCEQRGGFALRIDESRLEGVQRGSDLGAGVRVIADGTTYFAYVDGLAEADLLAAADAASAALAGRSRTPAALKPAAPFDLQEILVDPDTVDAARKADLLRACDETARAAGDAISQVQVGYAETRRRITVANSEGTFASDDRTRVRLGVQVVAMRDGIVETGFETLGAHRGFELVDEGNGERIAKEAAEKALIMLDADPAPARSLPVVVGGGFGGVLFHEMTGHGLEADHIQKGASVYTDMLGKQVAQPHLVAFDDGRLAGEWGTDGIDDEGTPSQKTTLIEEGRITSYLHDLKTARYFGTKSTGNGRRESFRHLPIPRMTNTYIAPGTATPEELIGEVADGFYAKSFAGGQVDPTSGDFVFGVSEGYLIRNGRIDKPLRGATLIGSCLEALRNIDAVANDFEMKTGFCGKEGQSVPVGTGQGHVLIGSMTVGGTAT